MRILIVGYDPHDIGGTQNYTRPLAQKFVEFGHRVFYLYSGAWNRKYNWLFKPYLKILREDIGFECAELYNSPNLAYNYDHLLMDIHNLQTEKLFLSYLSKIKPDVMHVHTRCGLPASIIEIASGQGVRVFNTVHVYGLICPKRIMLDKAEQSCGGPSDMEKCLDCLEPINRRKIKILARIENTNKNLLRFMVDINRRLRKKRSDETDAPAPKRTIPGQTKEGLKKALRQRLDYMIYVMNHHVIMNLCVSADVKRTLVRYGVDEKRIRIQHIGTLIAEKQSRNIRELHSPLVFGSIGGVGYYKGTHVLVEAISKVKRKNFIVKIFGKYDQNFVEDIMKEKKNLPIEFLGKYHLEELPDILRQIDVMVLPSICNDTAPQTIFESYSARIPIVASDIGGFPDFIKDGVSGCLFKPGDSYNLARKLEEILANPERISLLSKNIPPLKTITENALELLDLYTKNLTTVK